MTKDKQLDELRKRAIHNAIRRRRAGGKPFTEDDIVKDIQYIFDNPALLESTGNRLMAAGIAELFLLEALLPFWQEHPFATVYEAASKLHAQWPDVTDVESEVLKDVVTWEDSDDRLLMSEDEFVAHIQHGEDPALRQMAEKLAAAVFSQYPATWKHAPERLKRKPA